MTIQKPPVNYADIRKNLVLMVKRMTGLTCIRREPSESDAPRPQLPYMSYKITSPGVARGEADFDYTGTGTLFNYGQQLKMTVSFQLYAKDQDEAYSLMCLFQQSLNKQTVLEQFRVFGLAVWDFGNVADLTALLNTGYEARTQLDVFFGLASNLTDDQGAIESVVIEGTLDSDVIDFKIGE